MEKLLNNVEEITESIWRLHSIRAELELSSREVEERILTFEIEKERIEEALCVLYANAIADASTKEHLDPSSYEDGKVAGIRETIQIVGGTALLEKAVWKRIKMINEVQEQASRNLQE